MAAAAIAFYTVKDASLGSATSVFAVSVLLLPSSPLLDYADAVNFHMCRTRSLLLQRAESNAFHISPETPFRNKSKAEKQLSSHRQEYQHFSE